MLRREESCQLKMNHASYSTTSGNDEELRKKIRSVSVELIGSIKLTPFRKSNALVTAIFTYKDPFETINYTNQINA